MIMATAVIAAVLALIWTMQRRMMYFPGDGVPAPGEVGLSGLELVRFETADGLELSGWFLRQPGPSRQVTVLVFNGNAGNRGHRGPLAAALHRGGRQVAHDVRPAHHGPQRQIVRRHVVLGKRPFTRD